MQISLGIGEFGRPVPFGELVAQAQQASAFDTLWFNQVMGFDALTAVAVVGSAVPRPQLGTAVIPIWTRHPLVLAQQALTAQAATAGRLTLGIGASHVMVVEEMLGGSFVRPVEYVREFLEILLPLLAGEPVTFSGERLRLRSDRLAVPGGVACPVVLAALGPQMLNVAGTRTAGTVTWMAGVATIREHVVPTITRAAENADRGRPRVIVGLPVCVTADRELARQRASKMYAIYGQLPSYRAMLDRQDATGPADVALIGDEDSIGRDLRELEEAGATEVLAVEFGSATERLRTRALLEELASATLLE